MHEHVGREPLLQQRRERLNLLLAVAPLALEAVQLLGRFHGSLATAGGAGGAWGGLGAEEWALGARSRGWSGAPR